MSLNIKNEEVVRLVGELARITGESKTEAIRKALEERRARLAFRVADRNGLSDIREFLDREIWPFVPPKELGRKMTRKELDDILGYGPGGV